MIYGEWNWFAAAHELGHAFGLHHDFRDNEYIMSYGRANRSICTNYPRAPQNSWPSHPYFNPDVPLENVNRRLSLNSFHRDIRSGSASVPVRAESPR